MRFVEENNVKFIKLAFCEKCNDLLPYFIMEKHQVYFPGVAATCKGGFLTDTLKALKFKAKCETDFFDPERLFQGVRLVRQIK